MQFIGFRLQIEQKCTVKDNIHKIKLNKANGRKDISFLTLSTNETATHSYLNK